MASRAAPGAGGVRHPHDDAPRTHAVYAQRVDPATGLAWVLVGHAVTDAEGVLRLHLDTKLAVSRLRLVRLTPSRRPPNKRS